VGEEGELAAAWRGVGGSLFGGEAVRRCCVPCGGFLEADAVPPAAVEAK